MGYNCVSLDACVRHKQQPNMRHFYPNASSRNVCLVLQTSMVMKESSNHTKYASLSFPGASQVDVYPAKHISDFDKYNRASGMHDNSVIALPDDNLHLLKCTILEQGADLAAFKAHMKARGEDYLKLHYDGHARIFHVTATMPIKFLGFNSRVSYKTDRLSLEGDDIHGGPHQKIIVTTPIVNL